MRFGNVKALYKSYYSAGPKNRVLPFAKFSRLVALLRANQKTGGTFADVFRKMRPEISGLNPERVRRIALFAGIETGNAGYRQRGKSRSLASKEPGLRDTYLELRFGEHGMSQEAAVKRVGVDVSTARAWELHVSHAERKNRYKANTSNSNAYPLRGMLRLMLGRVNPDGSFKYSMKLIARVVGVDVDAVVNANQSPALIRGRASMAAFSEKFFGKSQSDISRLEGLARQEFEGILSAEKAKCNYARLASITPQERALLKMRILRYAGNVIPKDVPDIHYDKNAVQSVVLAFFSTAKLEIGQNEMGLRTNMLPAAANRAINFLNSGKFVKIIRRNGTMFSISPETLIFLI